MWKIDGYWESIPDMPPIEEMTPVIFVITFFLAIIQTSIFSNIGSGLSRLFKGSYVKSDNSEAPESIKIPVINSRLMIFVYSLLVVLIIGLVIVLASQNSINADKLNDKSLVADYDLATKVYERGDYDAALDLILPLAKNGYSKAQNSLGYLYLQGQGVQQNHIEAKKWFDKAAEQGTFKAQTSLAYLYENGLGVPKDLVKATNFYRKAAKQGYTKAQYYLGLAYMKGFDGSKDDVQA